MIRNTALCYETGSCADTPEQRRDEYLAAVEQSLELVRSSLDLSRLCELYRDSRGNAYMDDTGCIPFVRARAEGSRHLPLYRRGQL